MRKYRRAFVLGVCSTGVAVIAIAFLRAEWITTLALGTYLLADRFIPASIARDSSRLTSLSFVAFHAIILWMASAAFWVRVPRGGQRTLRIRQLLTVGSLTLPAVAVLSKTWAGLHALGFVLLAVSTNHRPDWGRPCRRYTRVYVALIIAIYLIALLAWPLAHRVDMP